MESRRNCYPFINVLLIAGFAFLPLKIFSQNSSKAIQYTSENGLSENVVYCIAKDTSGFIWVGTDYGLNRFDGYEFRHYHHDNADSSTLSDHSVLCMEKDRKGNFWIGTYNGLNYFNPYTGISKRIPLELAGMSPFITAITNTEDSLLLFLQQGASFSYDLQEGTTRQLHDENIQPDFKYQSYPFYNTIRATGSRIYDIESQNNTYWIGTSRGLYKFTDAQSLIIPEFNIEGRNISSRIEVRSLFNDEKGNIWIGTFGDGLIRCDIRDLPFKNIPIDNISSNNSQRMITRLFHWKENKIVVETNSRIYRIIHNGKPELIIDQHKLTPEWLASVSAGKNIASLTSFQKSVLSSGIDPFSIIFHDDTTVIVAKDGVWRLTPAGEKKLHDGYILHFTADANHYWLAGNHGLVRINKTTFADSTYTFTKELATSLSAPFLFYVYDDHNGHLWIGTKGGGLNVLYKAENKFNHYNTAHGLPDNVVYSILPDAMGHLWLSTNKGISKFDIVSQTFTNYSKRDGLINTEFNRLGSVLSDEGIIYMAGTAGIDYFDPKDFSIPKDQSEIHISGVKVNGLGVDQDSLSELKYYQNDLIFYFTANHFSYPEFVYYRYRLHNDQPWTRVQGINYASYSRLPPGHYSFEVQSGFDNNSWSRSAIINFSINTPWWSSWWFYMLIALFILSAFYLFYRYRIEQLKRLARLRSKISRDLHDEVGSTLSSIHVYSGIAAKSLGKNAEITEKALDHIRNNSRQVMDNMSDIVWAINNGSRGEGSLEDKLKNYGYELLTPLNIKVAYAIDPEAEKKLNHIEARKNILLIAKEAMNNIARYSNASSASVVMEIQNKQLQLTINDDGKGFDIKAGRKGNGLHNMKDRTEAMGGQFVIQSQQEKGTTVTCRIPITNISNT